MVQTPEQQAAVILQQETWVLLRGLGRETAHWGNFLQQLQLQRPNTSIITIDLPGCGEYYKERSPKSIQEITQHVRRSFLERSNTKGVINIIALSLGGMVAIDWAQNYPDEIRYIFLINTSSRWTPFWSRIHVPALLHLALTFMKGNIRDIEKTILHYVSNDTVIREKTLPHWVETQQARRVKKTTLINQIIAAARFRPRKSFSLVSGMILTSRADRLVSHQCSQAIAKQWGWPIAVHDAAGHDLPLDNPEWVTIQIIAFLDTNSP